MNFRTRRTERTEKQKELDAAEKAAHDAWIAAVKLADAAYHEMERTLALVIAGDTMEWREYARLGETHNAASLAERAAVKEEQRLHHEYLQALIKSSSE